MILYGVSDCHRLPPELICQMILLWLSPSEHKMEEQKLWKQRQERVLLHYQWRKTFFFPSFFRAAGLFIRSLLPQVVYREYYWVNNAVL